MRLNLAFVMKSIVDENRSELERLISLHNPRHQRVDENTYVFFPYAYPPVSIRPDHHIRCMFESAHGARTSFYDDMDVARIVCDSSIWKRANFDSLQQMFAPTSFCMDHVDCSVSFTVHNKRYHIKSLSLKEQFLISIRQMSPTILKKSIIVKSTNQLRTFFMQHASYVLVM